MRTVTRYVLANPTDADVKDMAVAKKAVKACGATVVRAFAGTLLIECEPAQVQSLQAALPEWLITPETKTARVPERTPAERTKAKTPRR